MVFCSYFFYVMMVYISDSFNWSINRCLGSFIVGFLLMDILWEVTLKRRHKKLIMFFQYQLWWRHGAGSWTYDFLFRAQWVRWEYYHYFTKNREAGLHHVGAVILSRSLWLEASVLSYSKFQFLVVWPWRSQLYIDLYQDMPEGRF